MKIKTCIESNYNLKIFMEILKMKCHLKKLQYLVIFQRVLHQSDYKF